MSAQPYDPYEPKGNDKINKIKDDINEAVESMRNNINQVQQRGEDLDGLSRSAGDLDQSARHLNEGAKRARRHFWKENMKMKICLIAAVIILIIVIVVPIAMHFKK